MPWFKKTSKSQPVLAPKKEELWVICPNCKAHIFRQEWEKNINVCPRCMFHDRIPWQKRLELLIDAGTFREFGTNIGVIDHLNFADASGKFIDKARATMAKTGLKESVITGHGKIHGLPVIIAIMEFEFLGGSLGSGTGEKITLAATRALRLKRPYIIVSASGGARMQEGIISLMQMAKTCAAIARLHQARIPYISVLTHPTTGGVSASYAMVGDVNIAEPGVLIGFAGRRVIEQTIKEKLPPGFQTAEYLLEHGFIDMIVTRREMKDTLYRILKYWMPNKTR